MLHVAYFRVASFFIKLELNWESIRNMAGLNEKILEYVSEKKEVNTIQIAELLNEDHQKVIGALKSIQAHGDLLIVEPQCSKIIGLTEEGKLVANNGKS